MRFAMACASHTPLLLKEQFASSSICDQVAHSFRRMAAFIDEVDDDNCHVVTHASNSAWGHRFQRPPRPVKS